MSDSPADDITDDLIQKCRDGMDKVGAELADRWRQMISVPVDRSGSKVIRSKPGEPPRRDSGGYQASIGHHTEADPNGVRTEAGTTMDRGVWLEKGTGRMKPRPHASKLADDFGGEVVDRVGGVIAEALKD